MSNSLYEICSVFSLSLVLNTLERLTLFDSLVPLSSVTTYVAKDGVFIRTLECYMSSGILAVPGGQAGELLVGYPSTSLSTNQATESGRMQLRCYLGAVLYKPEDVLILNHIACDGIGEQGKIEGFKTDANEVQSGVITITGHADAPDKAYHGSMWKYDNGKMNLIRSNAGHLGIMDSPEGVCRLYGSQQYERASAF